MSQNDKKYPDVTIVNVKGEETMKEDMIMDQKLTTNGTCKEDSLLADGADVALTSTTDDDPSPKGKYREREQWGSRIQFIISCISFAIGLGNVWRFPYLCYKNGGGAFLIPYLICLVTAGMPFFFLEVAIGQYWQTGGITVWGKISPIFKGIGYGTVIIVFLVNTYYIVILSWALLYLWYSFSYPLPWSTCGNEWNTDACWAPHNTDEVAIRNGTNKMVDSVVEFWERKILQISPGIDHPDGLQPELVVTLILAWIICFFCVWKGIKSTGKAVYVTAIFPYFMMTCLFIRGVTLPGASKGIQFYLSPDFSKLLDGQVWMDAGTQIFFSYGIAMACLTALGSYNEFHNDFYKQLFFVTAMNSGTSIFAGFAIFSVLGFMAHELGMEVGQVAEAGPGLAFIAYPKGVAQMPGSTGWAILFFVMILLLGLGSELVAVEGFVTAVVDAFPQYLRYGHRREYFIATTGAFSFLVGLSMVNRGGMYVFQIFDYYGASGMCLLWFSFFEAVVIGWVYGADRFIGNMEEMLGYRITPWLKYCWKYITPAMTGGIFIFFLITYKPLTYNVDYHYPAWAIGLGWSMALSSMVALPVYIAYIWIITPGDSWTKKWKELTEASPSEASTKTAQANHLSVDSHLNGIGIQSSGGDLDEQNLKNLQETKY